MSKAKQSYFLPVIHFLKLTFFFVAVFSALLSWMFVIARTTELGTYDAVKTTEQRIEGLQVITNMANSLLSISIFFWISGLILAVIYFAASKKVNKKSGVKTISSVFFVSLLMIITILHEYILKQLISISLY